MPYFDFDQPENDRLRYRVGRIRKVPATAIDRALERTTYSGSRPITRITSVLVTGERVAAVGLGDHAVGRQENALRAAEFIKPPGGSTDAFLDAYAENRR